MRLPPENIRIATSLVLYTIFEKFYNLFGLDWHNAGMRCQTCKCSKICDVMLKIYFLIICL